MFISAVFLVLPCILQVFAAGQCARYYTVKAGDYCDSISAANQVSTYQLAAINHIIDDDCRNLVPGFTLCLGHQGEDCTTTYKVVAGDTCESIATQHSINTTILYLNNPQINHACSNIYVNEVLCVLNQVQVPPAPADFTPAATIPHTAIPANPSVHHTTTYYTSYTTITAAHPTSTSHQGSSNANQADDENIPFCDEL